MKPRILLIVVIALACACGLFLIRRPAVKSVVLSDTDVKNNSTSSSIQPNAPSSEAQAIDFSSTKAPTNNDRQKPPEAIRRYVESKNSSVSFYAKVVDQVGSPLQGVRASLKVRQWTSETNSIVGRMVSLQRETDSDGRFDVNDIMGDALDLESLAKEGYELEPSQRTFGAFVGNVSDPFIFKMWRAGVTGPLISGSSTFDILADGRQYIIDITNATISEAGQGRGDLEVWIKRPDKITPTERFPWSCELRAIAGGLSEEPNGYSSMYVAPIEGYSNTFHFDAPNGWGASTGTRRFYLNLSNGSIYGRASIEILSYFHHQEPGIIRIDYAVNPQGSRVLR